MCCRVACVAERHAWQGACMGGMCLRGVCMAGEMATAPDSMYPTGMLSCYNSFYHMYDFFQSH